MTLTEKASQLVNQARAIPRLGIPAYDWWSESLHGVAVDGTTIFPEPIGLAATFDPSGIHDMAEAIGIEGRVKHQEAQHAGHSDIYEGLDFWAPNVNIFRDPRWGRGQETYGEDPFLTARLAVAFVTGMQGTDPTHYMAIATPKHFAIHSGPETSRHFADVHVSRHDEEDTYLPAFRAAIVEGHAGSIMCAYNAVNGQPACANDFLLRHTLREAWHFQGYVVSDCGAVRDIVDGHHFSASQPQASAAALDRGMDNECVDYLEKISDDRDYRPYIDAVDQGYLSERAIDTALVRLFVARFRLGMLDPPERTRTLMVDPTQLDSSAHRALALRLANESIVLLKNDGVLPLRSVHRILVVGPLAEQTSVLLGNYSAIPTRTTSILQGLRSEFPGAAITYMRGTQFLSEKGSPVPPMVLTALDGTPGVTAEYSFTQHFDTPFVANFSRNEPAIDTHLTQLPEQAGGHSSLSIRWTGLLQPKDTGDYLLGITTNGSARVSIGDQEIVQMAGPGTMLARVHLENGHAEKLEVNYGNARGASDPEVQLIWTAVNDSPDIGAIKAAQDADVIVAAVGITSRLEGEEMKTSQPGFFGGDRTSLNLPQQEEDLVRLLASCDKPLVLVLLNGSALSTTWEKEHVPAILDAWYPGEEGGMAVAQTLSGKNSPAGRLPVTVYKNVQQLPPFDDYAMKGRTYRYFRGEPLWPFGYGLSYTQFQYKDLTVREASIKAGAPLDISVKVTNVGALPGDEVAQLYLQFPDVPGAPIRALRGFKRINLRVQDTCVVNFHLEPRDMSMVTDDGATIVAQGHYTVWVGGGQPQTQAPGLRTQFEIVGQLSLPE